MLDRQDKVQHGQNAAPIAYIKVVAGLATRRMLLVCIKSPVGPVSNIVFRGNRLRIGRMSVKAGPQVQTRNDVPSG